MEDGDQGSIEKAQVSLLDCEERTVVAFSSKSALLLYLRLPRYTSTVTIGTKARSTNQSGARDQRSSLRVREKRVKCSGVQYQGLGAEAVYRAWIPGNRSKPKLLEIRYKATSAAEFCFLSRSAHRGVAGKGVPCQALISEFLLFVCFID